jgi:oligopeptide/dipeptide ABC transporter ATP-binding protein
MMQPYNQALQRTIPVLNEKGTELSTILGSRPDVSKRIDGPFAPRCQFAQEKCVTSAMVLKEVARSFLRLLTNSIRRDRSRTRGFAGGISK